MAHPKRRKASSSAQTDIISNLPGIIKENILTFLPIKEAVRTSILSSAWRYTWASITELTIEDSDCISNNYTFFEDDRMIHLVDMILFLHDGPIHKFDFSTELHCPEAFDRWILNLSRNGIRELSLNLDSSMEYPIPSCFFSCDMLNNIYFSYCSIKLPRGFTGFKFLHKLHLDSFSISPADMEKLILNCPALENLLLWNFTECDSLNIHAPNLLNLDIYGEFTDLRLQAPRLLTIRVDLTVSQFDKDRRKSNLVRAFRQIPKVERLEMLQHFVPYLASGPLLKKFPLKFNHLEVICMEIYLEDKEESAFALSLFQNSPQLKELTIRMIYVEGEPESPSTNFWELREGRDCLFEHIHTASIRDFVATESGLAFVKFLLACAPQLERLMISEENSGQNKDDRLMFKKLLRFPRASTKAEIVFV